MGYDKPQVFERYEDDQTESPDTPAGGSALGRYTPQVVPAASPISQAMAVQFIKELGVRIDQQLLTPSPRTELLATPVAEQRVVIPLGLYRRLMQHHLSGGPAPDKFVVRAVARRLEEQEPEQAL